MTERRRALADPSEMAHVIDLGRRSKLLHTGMWDIAMWYMVPAINGASSSYSTVATGSSIRIARKQQQRFYTNQLLPVYRATLGLLRSVFPHLTTVPMSPSWDNIRKALASRQVLRAWWQLNDMERRLNGVAQWLSPTGNVALHNYFDPGRRKVCCELVSPYDLVYEENARSTDESRFVAIRKWHTVDDLLEAYGEKEREVITASVDAEKNVDARDSRHVPPPKDRVVVWYVYTADGYQGVLLGEKWLWGPEKLLKGVEPVQLVRFLPVQQVLWGVSQMYPLIDPNSVYNEFRNLTIDIARLTSNPVWVMANQAMVDPASVTNAPGAVIRYNSHAPPPVRTRGVDVPQHLFELQGRALAEVYDLAGVHSTSMGKRAVGVVSGKAMDTLASNDAGQLAPVRGELEYAVTRSARTALILWRHHIPEEQHVRLFDVPIGSVTYASVRGTDLLDDPEVFIEAGSLFKGSQAARDQVLLDLHERGLVPPEKVMEQLSIRIGDQDAMQKMVYIDRAQAALDTATAGGMVEFWPGPDIPTVIEVFEEYISSPEYYADVVRWKQRVDAGDVTAIPYLKRAMDIADYIRDIVISLKLPLQADPQQVIAAQQAKLFPRAAPTSAGGIQMAAANDSETGQRQSMQGVNKLENIKQNVDMAQSAYDALKGTPGVTGGFG